MSGEGAFLFGGRWNPAGYHLVYAAEHLSLAVLEVLVHIDDRKKLNDYVLMTLELPNPIDLAVDLSAGWQDDINETQRIGRDWLESGKSLVLRVPSVILTQENNVLINPKHPDMENVEASSEDFVFDARLWKA